MITLTQTRLAATPAPAPRGSCSDNGVSFFKGNRTTVTPSGSLEVHARTANHAGADQILARATNSRTGETCTGRVTLP